MSVKNRGKRLEKWLDMTNTAYWNRNLGVIDKVPTPWTVRYNRQQNKVIAAWPQKKSTVDYLGAAQGRAIAFEAKSTRERTRFPLDNIEPHQIEFLRRYHQTGGVAFLIIHFEKLGETYYLPFFSLEKYLEAADDGGRKSIPIGDFRTNYPQIRSKDGFILHYLEYALGGL